MPPDNLSAVDQLQARPHGFSLFAALRALERFNFERPRLGESRKAADDAVRLGQTPHLSFAASDVATVVANDEGRLSLEQYGFGLFGPNGALPLHFTELAFERRRQNDDGTIVDFLNLFQHRLISLFFRAWADSDPAANFDRPDSDRFRTYMGALVGLAPDSARGADGLGDLAKLGRVGRLAPQVRSTDGLEAVIADYFGTPAEVRPFAGAWLDIPQDLHCRLGEQRLGLNTTLGASTWQCQHKFEIALGPLPRDEFSNFLPGAPGLAELHALVRLYTNDEWDWQLRLLLRDVEMPGLCLGASGGVAKAEGSSQLGWTSWLGAPRTGAQDVVIQESRARAVAADPNTSGARYHG